MLLTRPIVPTTSLLLWFTIQTLSFLLQFVLPFLRQRFAKVAVLSFFSFSNKLCSTLKFGVRVKSSCWTRAFTVCKNKNSLIFSCGAVGDEDDYVDVSTLILRNYHLSLITLYNPGQKSWDTKQVLPSPHLQC